MFDMKEIRRLLDAFEASDWDEVHLVADGVELHVSAGDDRVGPALPAPATPAIAPPAATTTATPPATGANPGQAVPPPAPGVPELEAIPDAGDLHGLHAVVSPSPGIFWRSPAPGEHPFTDVGQRVEPGTPIGIVEVMKLMNQVLAGVSGTVKAVLVPNGERVDRGQALVLVEPDA